MLLAADSQQFAAAALLELDGIAARIVIATPDLGPEHVRTVIDKAAVDVVVSESGAGWKPACDRGYQTADQYVTEWVLMTSGTTGAPKMIAHTFASLTAPIGPRARSSENTVWATFYDIRRYGGLQIFLRAVLGGTQLVLSNAGEPVGDYLRRVAEGGVTHISGTPSHWRRALMSPTAREIAPRYIRLSGEIADQAILDALRSAYPKSAISHAFASTEAGVAFEVTDGLAGFPESLLAKHGDVEMKIRDGSLLIRSNRTASRYLDAESGPLASEDGFVDTGDTLELREGRYYFLGRRNGVVNVGGLKVYPEEVEAVINRHPAVRMSVVKARKNPLTGALVAAEVVVNVGHADPALAGEILDLCRRNLPRHKIPASIRCVGAVRVAAAGKLDRHA